MHAVAAAIVLLLTILLSFCLGIVSGYAAIRGVLWAFQQRRRARPAAAAVETGD